MPLPPNSRDVVRRDPALCGLALLLDQAALAKRLDAKRVTRIDMRYKPGVSCTVGLHIVGSDDAEHWLCAKAYTQDRFEQIKSRRNWRSGRFQVTLFEDICVAIIPAQRDRNLKVLSTLLDPEDGNDKLSKISAKINGGMFGSPELHILRYKPNRRLVAQIVDGASGSKAMLKVHRPSSYPTAERGAHVAAKLGGAAVLVTNRQKGVIICDWLPGTSLCPIDSTTDLERFRMAGRRIAEHHKLSFDLPRLSRASEVTAFQSVAGNLASIMPDYAKRFAHIATRATAALLTQPTTQGLIHGDFSADQVISHADDVRVIDWDRAANGDQGRDIGSFLARLDIQILTGVVDPIFATYLKTAFLEGYQEQRVLPASFQAQHICHLVLLLTEPFRAQSPEWYKFTCALMDRIEALLKAAPVSVTDPALPHLADALSPDLAEAVITARTAMILTAPPKLYRHKPGKRAMIQYACRTQAGQKRTLLCKMRSRGRDQRTPAVQTALRAAGLDGKHGVGVPKVVDIPNPWDIWFMEHVPGTCLRDLQDSDQTGSFFQAGGALGRLHNSGVVPDRSWTRRDEIDVLAAALHKAAATLPCEEPRLVGLLNWAEREVHHLPYQRPTCIHRDFYSDQVIVDESRIWLVDLDLVALGDPAIDVGNFLAHLAEYALRVHGTTVAADKLETAFLKGYQSTGVGLCPRRIAVFRTISLLRHIHISRRFEDRHHTTQALLAQGEALSGCV